MTIKGAAVMISHARNAYFAIVANVLSGPLLSGKPQGKRESLFDACAPRGGHDAGEPLRARATELPSDRKTH